MSVLYIVIIVINKMYFLSKWRFKIQKLQLLPSLIFIKSCEMGINVLLSLTTEQVTCPGSQLAPDSQAVESLYLGKCLLLIPFNPPFWFHIYNSFMTQKKRAGAISIELRDYLALNASVGRRPSAKRVWPSNFGS